MNHPIRDQETQIHYSTVSIEMNPGSYTDQVPFSKKKNILNNEIVKSMETKNGEAPRMVYYFYLPSILHIDKQSYSVGLQAFLG